MTTYTTIPNGDIDQDSPVTQPLVTALRDNPLAIQEGTAGSPIIQGAWHPYDDTVAGTGGGVVYDWNTDGTVASVETPAFADGYEYRIICCDMRPTISTAVLQIGWYQETDAVYEADKAIGEAQTISERLSAVIDMATPRLAAFLNHPALAHYVMTGDSVGVLPVGFYDPTAQKVGKARIRYSTGNIDRGVIYMLRRRDYLT